jgi:NAD+ synthase
VRNLNLNIVEESLIREIRSFVGTKNIFIGISGGIDSALVAFLSVKALGRKRVFGLLMPYGRQKDINDALAVVGQLGIKYFSKDIKPIVDQYKISENKYVLGNIMSRVRMTILYAYANHKNALVAGTTNKSEMSIGYFTKFGDGACDFEAIANLYKTEVFQLAKQLNIPPAVIDKKPSASLWNDQFDEDEFGFTYKQLDRFLQGDLVDEEIESRIKQLISLSEHKRHLPPTFSID